METQTTKAVATKTKNEVAAISTNHSDWGLDETDSRDMIIPRIMLAQALSAAVTNGQVTAGSIYNSVTNAVIGSCAEKNPKTAQFIAFKEEVLWRIEKYEGNRWKYAYEEPRPASSENRAQEFTVDGIKHRPVKLLRYYVLLMEDLKNPVPFPCTLDFKMSSFQAGKTLHNHFAITKSAMQKGHKVNPADTAFELGGHITKNDQGTFFVYDVKPVEGKTKPEHQRVAYDWLQTLKTATYKVDETEEVETSTDAKTVTENSQF